MKKLFLLLFIFISISLVYGQTDLNEFKRIQFINEGFSIGIPQNWEVMKNAYGKVLIAISPKEHDNDFTENIIIDVILNKNNGKINDYKRIMIEEVKEMQYSEIILIQKFKHNQNIETITYDYIQNGIKIRQISYIILWNDKVYLIMCASTPASFDNYIKTFDNIILSFKYM